MDKNLDLVRKCLTLVGRIAARSAAAQDPQYVSDILFQLSYAFETYPYSFADVRAAHFVKEHSSAP